eukprot:SAG25_NODE_354_length_9250_cov_2.824281_6_plen_57_part_00
MRGGDDEDDEDNEMKDDEMKDEDNETKREPKITLEPPQNQKRGKTRTNKGEKEMIV